MARPGKARRGEAWRGKAGRGMARQDTYTERPPVTEETGEGNYGNWLAGN
jgi:hypothetical protein